MRLDPSPEALNKLNAVVLLGARFFEILLSPKIQSKI